MSLLRGNDVQGNLDTQCSSGAFQGQDYMFYVLASYGLRGTISLKNGTFGEVVLATIDFCGAFPNGTQGYSNAYNLKRLLDAQVQCSLELEERRRYFSPENDYSGALVLGGGQQEHHAARSSAQTESRMIATERREAVLSGAMWKNKAKQAGAPSTHDKPALNRQMMRAATQEEEKHSPKNLRGTHSRRLLQEIGPPQVLWVEDCCEDPGPNYNPPTTGPSKVKFWGTYTFSAGMGDKIVFIQSIGDQPSNDPDCLDSSGKL